MVELTTHNVVNVARKYFKYVILGKNDSARLLEKRYPVITALTRVLCDLDKVGNGNCPFCGRRFESKVGLYKHIQYSSCKLDYAFSLFSVYKVWELLGKRYIRNKGCYEVASMCYKPKDLSKRILEVRLSYSQIMRSLKSQELKEDRVF